MYNSQYVYIGYTKVHLFRRAQLPQGVSDAHIGRPVAIATRYVYSLYSVCMYV